MDDAVIELTDFYAKSPAVSMNLYLLSLGY